MFIGANETHRLHRLPFKGVVIRYGPSRKLEVGLSNHLSSVQKNIDFSGVNVSGLLTSNGGPSELTRGYIAALKALNIPLAFNDISYMDNPPNNAGLWDLSSANPHAINLACAGVDLAAKFISEAGSHYFKSKYNIAAWAWESPEFPSSWLPLFDIFDEIWVASSFEQECLNRYSPIPIYKIEPVIEFEPPKDIPKEEFGLSSEEFTYLFVFDCRSFYREKIHKA